MPLLLLNRCALLLEPSTQLCKRARCRRACHGYANYSRSLFTSYQVSFIRACPSLATHNAWERRWREGGEVEGWGVHGGQFKDDVFPLSSMTCPSLSLPCAPPSRRQTREQEDVANGRPCGAGGGARFSHIFIHHLLVTVSRTGRR